MDKSEIEAMLETSFSWPEAQVSGEYLAKHVCRDAERAAALDRGVLLQVLRDWLAGCQEPRTSLALEVAEHMSLCELQPDIAALRERVASGQALRPYYLEYFDRALAALRKYEGSA